MPSEAGVKARVVRQGVMLLLGEDKQVSGGGVSERSCRPHRDSGGNRFQLGPHVARDGATATIESVHASKHLGVTRS